MIYGDLASLETEMNSYPTALHQGLKYLQSTDFTKVVNGKYELDGELLFAMVSETVTKPASEQKAESHQAYVDIQFLLEGEEKIYVAKSSAAQEMSENNLSEKDYAFYSKVEHEQELVLKPEEFAIFFPSDIHRPCCSASENAPIRKVVVKIHLSLFSV